MVDGRQELKGKCVVTDLDGTLIRSNSTRMLARDVLRRALFKCRLYDLARAIAAIVRRKLRLVDHRAMKHTLVGIAQKTWSSDDQKKFASRLVSTVNPIVADLIRKHHRQGSELLIATAAADFFMPDFLASAGLDASYIATAYRDSLPEYVENKGEEKLRRVRDYLTDHNLDLAVFLTDHSDDMALLLENNGKNILVNPSEGTVAACRSRGVSFDLLPI